VKSWVFNPALNCPRLMDDKRRCDRSAFQMAGAATFELCRPSCVLVKGTSMYCQVNENLSAILLYIHICLYYVCFKISLFCCYRPLQPEIILIVCLIE